MVNLGRGHAAERIAKSLVFNRFLVPIFERRAKRDFPQFIVFSSDLIGQGINFYGFWEHEELMALSEWLEANQLIGGTMLDVGANIGNHGVFLSRWYRKVIAVEANPRTFDVLSLNASLVPNMQCVRIAASDRNGSVRFLKEHSNVGHSRIAGDRCGEPTIEVDCWRLDDYFPDVDDLRLVKIDVEGHEVQAIRGMERLLARCSPIVMIEQQPEAFEDGKSPAVEMLRSRGYTEFYAIERVPSTKQGGMAGKAWFFLCSLFTGFRLTVKRQDDIRPAFYEMLIAKKGADAG